MRGEVCVCVCTENADTCRNFGTRIEEFRENISRRASLDDSLDEWE